LSFTGKITIGRTKWRKGRNDKAEGGRDGRECRRKRIGEKGMKGKRKWKGQ